MDSLFPVGPRKEVFAQKTPFSDADITAFPFSSRLIALALVIRGNNGLLFR